MPTKRTPPAYKKTRSQVDKDLFDPCPGSSEEDRRRNIADCPQSTRASQTSTQTRPPPTPTQSSQGEADRRARAARRAAETAGFTTNPGSASRSSSSSKSRSRPPTRTLAQYRTKNADISDSDLLADSSALLSESHGDNSAFVFFTQDGQDILPSNLSWRTSLTAPWD